MSSENTLRLFKKWIKNTPKDDIIKTFNKYKTNKNDVSLEEYFDRMEEQLDINKMS